MNNDFNWVHVWEEVIAGILVLILAWFFSKSFRKWVILTFCKIRFRLLPTLFNVGILINFKEGKNSEIYFSEIRQNLKDEIERLDLTKIIRIKDWSNIHTFKNKREAESYGAKKELDLIVWGEFSTDGLKEGGELVNRLKLNFTYRYVKDLKDCDDRIGKALFADISSKLALKNYWKILDNNSANDIEIVSRNLTDLSLYILGLTLKFYWKLFESIKIFEQLFSKLLRESKDDQLKKSTLFHIMDCYSVLITDAIYKKNPHLGKRYCEKILTYQKDDLSTLAGLARFEYELGNSKKCEEIVAKLLMLYPDSPTVWVDVAFIYILQKKYKDAFCYYEKLRNMDHTKPIDFFPLDLIKFLTEEHQIKREPAFLYVRGIISYYWADRKLGKEDLQDFLSISNELNYKHMRKRARSLLT